IVSSDEAIATAVGIENLLVRREGDAIGVRDVVDDPGHLAILDHIDAVEVELLSGIVLAQPEPSIAIGEIDRSILLDYDIVSPTEPFALEFVGQHGALAIGLDAVDRTPSPGRDHEPPLPVEGQPVAPDHGELLVAWFTPELAVRLHEADTPDIDALVPAFLHVDGHLSVRCPFVDHVARHFAEQQVTRALWHPERALGKTKATRNFFQLSVRINELAERRVLLIHRRRASRRLRSNRTDGQAGEDHGAKNTSTDFLHE